MRGHVRAAHGSARHRHRCERDPGRALGRARHGSLRALADPRTAARDETLFRADALPHRAPQRRRLRGRRRRASRKRCALGASSHVRPFGGRKSAPHTHDVLGHRPLSLHAGGAGPRRNRTRSSASASLAPDFARHPARAAPPRPRQRGPGPGAGALRARCRAGGLRDLRSEKPRVLRAARLRGHRPAPAGRQRRHQLHAPPRAARPAKTVSRKKNRSRLRR